MRVIRIVVDVDGARLEVHRGDAGAPDVIVNMDAALLRQLSERALAAAGRLDELAGKAKK